MKILQSNKIHELLAASFLLNVKRESGSISCSSGVDIFQPWIGHSELVLPRSHIKLDKTAINRKKAFLSLVISMPPHVSIIKINDSKK